MRYLHISRTIHQLVTDRNRVVGLYLAVPSLLYTASWAVLNAKPGVQLIVPMCASAHPSMSTVGASLSAGCIWSGRG